MRNDERIKDAIRDIARRRKNVMLDEIEWVIEQLGVHYEVRRRQARHGVLFRIGSRRFMVNVHNPGNKQVKTYSVDDFIDAMFELGWYEE